MKRTILITLALGFVVAFDSGNLFAQQQGRARTRQSKTSSVSPVKQTNNTEAWILLPKNWDGKSILVKAFKSVPCVGDDCYTDFVRKDIEHKFYNRPLSPNAVIKAGITTNSELKTRKMTVNEFANYLRNLGYAVEGDNSFGIATHVVYKNGTITEIEEEYME